LIGRSFNASIIVSSDIQPVSSRKSQKKSAKPGLSLHNRSSLQHVEVLHLLQDCFKSGPTWRVHQLRAERGVFGGRDAAEEREFVLAQDVEAGDVGKQVEVGNCDNSLGLV